MVRKPRRPRAQHIVKSLLDLEIPEIQSMANKLAEQIKDLGEQSAILQEYVDEIEDMATDGANAMAESRIAELLKDLNAALKELRYKPKKALASGAETRAAAPRSATVKEEPEEEVEEAEEEIAAGQGMLLERVITPEGYVIKKVRH
jgi:uncharacterized protein YdeI (YjbR/CyaY-like superfamily)